MYLGDLTIQRLCDWELLTESALEITKRWRAVIFKTDRPTKKEDLLQIAKLEAQINAAEKVVESLHWELQRLESMRKQDQEKHQKLQRYCKALGGDPSLIYWHRDSDFV